MKNVYKGLTPDLFEYVRSGKFERIIGWMEHYAETQMAPQVVNEAKTGTLESIRSKSGRYEGFIFSLELLKGIRSPDASQESD